MIHLFTVLFIAFFLSFIGSLLPGIINVSVALKTIKFDLKTGLILAFGAAVMEWFQSYVAIIFVDLFTLSSLYNQSFQFIALFMFIGLAIYYFFFAKTTIPNSRSIDKKKSGTFFQGMAIAGMNVLVFPYWVFYMSLLKSQGWIEDGILTTLVFCTGVALGAFLVFWIYAKGAKKFVRNPASFIGPANIIVAVIFLILGIYQFMTMT